MNTPKRILVATDFSQPSQIAISRAVELAKTNKAQLTILHVAKKGLLETIMKATAPSIGKILITAEEYATTLLKKQIDKLSKNKIKIKYAVIRGEHPGPKILKYAKDHKMNLLVLGAHGKYSVHDWFVGTTAEYIAKKTQLPVLIIKKLSHKSYRKILIPIDFSAASKNALQFATQLFPKTDLRLLHVENRDYADLLKTKESDPKENMKKLIKEFGNKLTQSHYNIKTGYPGIVIVDAAKKLNQDLVVMGTQGHSQHHYLLIGRVASRVLIEIDRDILLVPPKKK